MHDTLDKLLQKDTDLLRSTGWMRTDRSAVVDAADMTVAFNGQDGTWYAVGSALRHGMSRMAGVMPMDIETIYRLYFRDVCLFCRGLPAVKRWLRS